MKLLYLLRLHVYLSFCGILLIPLSVQSQAPNEDIFDYRMIDGSFNDLLNRSEGMAGNEFIRMHDKSYYFEDGESMMDRGNVRRISNQMFNQYTSRPDPNHLSSMVFTFLQFLDHDITFTKQGNTESSPILIPEGDPHFDPFATGRMTIPFMRVASSSRSNTQREQVNEITAWIDASNVYGSDESRANWLRSGSCGKLKVSPSPNGDLLPCNTTTGNCNDPLDANAPTMDHDRNQHGQPARVFVAGDVRANEQPGLTALHTLFVREHNRICDQLTAQYGCNDEANYQRARKIVGGLIQSVVYNELLPILGVDLQDDSYSREAVGDIHNSFATAAYRLGHTMVTETLPLLYENCEKEVPTFQLIPLRNAFFNPDIVFNDGILPILNGLSSQTQEAIDPKIVHSIRNFLFGAPGSGGLDLAALNIQRGRDHGLPDFNSLRKMLGLFRARNFSQISQNEQIAATLEDIYSSVDNIDAWVGMLSEPPLPNKSVGETIHALLSYQFNNLRKADRFYYTRDPILESSEIHRITNTKLADIINRNTSFYQVPQNVFVNESQCIPTTESSKENIVECNEVLIQFEETGKLSIQGTHGLEYAYEIARDPMGFSVLYKCPRSCGDSYETTLPVGIHYVKVKNKRNRTICEATVKVKPPTTGPGTSSRLVAQANGSPTSTLSVFPNPANSLVNINLVLPATEQADLYIVNMLGKVVHTLTSSGSATHQINVGHLPAGVYEVVAQSNESGYEMRQKISVQ